MHVVLEVEALAARAAFLDFELRLRAEPAEASLGLTGPEGAKEVLTPLIERRR
ncbi:MAG: hypothetical protein R3190_17530 [Thermoanaerobaculia bacterium]|nr:hypothetical protein [Thermoanaerobaculia bacterium]